MTHLDLKSVFKQSSGGQILFMSMHFPKQSVLSTHGRPGCVTKELRNLHITSLRSDLYVFQDLLFLAKEKFNNGCEMVSGCILKIYFSGAPLTFRNAMFSQVHDKLCKPFVSRSCY